MRFVNRQSAIGNGSLEIFNSNSLRKILRVQQFFNIGTFKSGKVFLYQNRNLILNQ
jgi:hypothetical protein